jgi:DNA-binding transcriptional LysR family regulator
MLDGHTSAMELRTLRYFVATVDAGSISAAALEVHVTQPSLSRQLRSLERALGVSLFVRGQRRLVLSAAGHAILPRARALIADADRIRQEARLFAQGRLEQVTIAAPTTTLTDVVSPFLATLEPDDPVPSVREADGLGAEESLRHGADLVIVGSRPSAALASHPLPPLPLWAYLPREHAWIGRTSVDLSELATEPLLLLPTTHTSRKVLDAALAARGLAADHVLVASNGTVAQALVAAGRGIAVISDDPRFDLDRVAVHVTSSPTNGTPGSEPLSVRLYCAWDRAHPAAATVQSIAERIGEYTIARYAADESA